MNTTHKSRFFGEDRDRSKPKLSKENKRHRELQMLARRCDFRVVLSMPRGRWHYVQNSRIGRRDGARQPARDVESKRKARRQMARASRRRNRG